jgi:hypothetical protein
MSSTGNLPGWTAGWKTLAAAGGHLVESPDDLLGGGGGIYSMRFSAVSGRSQ